MMRVMSRKADPDFGIWYPEEFNRLWREKYGKPMPKTCWTGYIDRGYFKKVVSEEDEDILFTLRSGKSPSEGLERFFQGPTVATCGRTAIACGLKALCQTIGAVAFDRLFSQEEPFVIEDDVSERFFTQPLSDRQSYMGTFGRRPVEIGDICRFESRVQYKRKHPCGIGEGLNCVYMGENAFGQQVFGGLGLSHSSTEEEIIQFLIDDYNEERSPQDIECIRSLGNPESFDLSLCLPIVGKTSQQLEAEGIVTFYPEGTFRLKAPNS